MIERFEETIQLEEDDMFEADEKTEVIVLPSNGRSIAEIAWRQPLFLPIPQDFDFEAKTVVLLRDDPL